MFTLKRIDRRPGHPGPLTTPAQRLAEKTSVPAPARQAPQRITGAKSHAAVGPIGLRQG
jgi:hypothetical protein